MRRERQGKSCSAAVAVCCAGVAGAVLAADIPFWGGGSSMPSRAPTSQSVAATATTLDSRTVQTVSSAAVRFNSDGNPGLLITVR